MKNSKRLRLFSQMYFIQWLFLTVLFSLVAMSGYAQSKTITGKIIDSTGEPVIGASVLVKGTIFCTFVRYGTYDLGMRKLFLLLVSVLFSLYVAADVEIRSEHLTTSNGISNNSVRCMYQDSKGFIWMGTLNGLSRYDGNSFVTYRPSQKGGIALGDHRIRDLVEDKNGFCG